MRVFQFATLLLASPAFSFVPQSARTQIDVSLNAKRVPQFDPFHLEENDAIQPATATGTMDSEIKALALAALVVGTPATASAATAFAGNAIPSALAAYGHYASLLGVLTCVLIERLTIKPNMSEREEDLITAADIGYGVWGLLITYTGYLRATSYEKGWDFYSANPLFWLKICFFGSKRLF